MNSYDVLVDPDQMLLVAFVDEDGAEREEAAVWCRYVPLADATGTRRIAAELVTDPHHPRPIRRYFCPRDRLQRRLLPPTLLRRVRPYARSS